jgi:hypothetical protein
MELDELKDIWQKGHQNSPQHQSHSIEDIVALLKNRTLGILTKINRSILIEVVLTIVMMFAGYFAYGDSKSAILIISIAAVISFIHYGLKYRLLNNPKYLEGNLKEVLTRLSHILSRYVIGYQILMWALFVFSNSVVLIELIDNSNRTDFTTQKLLFIFGLLIVCNLGVYYFIRNYLRILYENNLNDLLVCLKELESN